MKHKEPYLTLSSLLKVDVLELNESEVMEHLANIIDMAGYEQSLEGLNYAESLLANVSENDLTDYHACRAHYFQANIHSARYQLSEDNQRWKWINKTFDQEILELRKTILHAGFSELEPMERAQVYTNLGNALNHIGRFIEAIEYWDRAITEVPRFAMAYGNRGFGLGVYATAHYDSGHEAVLMMAGHASLSEASSENAIFDSLYPSHVIESFSRKMLVIEQRYDIPYITENTDFENHSMGRGKKEREYRHWCLKNRLFLNSLNDVSSSPISAQDVLTLPSLHGSLDDETNNPPIIIHYFNLIKQEFCSARYALYEGLNYDGVHFSDRKVLLYNTFDYPSHGFAIERIKMAFRGAYSIFDKIAFLLNVYLDLQLSERHINFRNVWLTRKGDDIHPTFNKLENGPLRGLFWLSKDIFDNTFRETTEPDSQKLFELRNHLEHKFVSVHDNWFKNHSQDYIESHKTGILDIYDNELIDKTLRQLKLARSAIIYLSLGIHIEEKQKSDNLDPDTVIMPMILDTWDDNWKRKY